MGGKEGGTRIVVVRGVQIMSGEVKFLCTLGRYSSVGARFGMAGVVISTVDMGVSIYAISFLSLPSSIS